MEMTLWSAGKNGWYAKKYTVEGAILLASWLLALAAFLFAPYEEVDIFSRIFIAIFFSMVTFFIPWIGITLVIECPKKLKRNKEFSMQLIPINEFSNGNYTGCNVVFADEHGVAIVKDEEAYRDWDFFNNPGRYYELVCLYNKQK